MLARKSSSQFETWLDKRNETIKSLRQLADAQDRLQKYVDLTNLCGTSASVLSGAGTLLSMLAAPFTDGASLVGMVPSAGLGVAGGLVNIGAYIGKHFREKDLIKHVQKALDDGRRESELLNKTRENEKLNQADFDTAGVGRKVVSNGKQAYELYWDVKEYMTTERVIQVAASAVKLENVTRAALTSKGGTSAARAANTSRLAAKAASKSFVVMTALLLPLDILDLVQTSINVNKGSINESAKEVRRIADTLEAEKEEFEHDVSTVEDVNITLR